MVELASALGQKRLKATRARMIAARSSSPYFDSASWVRCFEVGLRKAWKGLRRKQTKGLKSLPHLLVDPASCFPSYGEPASPEARQRFTPVPVMPRLRRAQVATDTPNAGEPKVEAEVSSSVPRAREAKSVRRTTARPKNAASLRPGRPCSEASDCEAGSSCKERCCNSAGGASVGCNACDGEGDCADCDQEYVLFADRCEPRASSPWVAPEPGGAAEPVPSSPSPPLWFVRHPHSGESETNRPNHVPTEDDGAATEAARQQLHQLVGDLRGMVQEEPALRERLRDKHGFMVADQRI